MKSDHYKKLEEIFHTANVNKLPYRGMKLEVEAEKAIVTYPVSSDFFHKMEALHGSVYFKMLDDAAYFAVNSVIQDVFVLTTSFSIDLLRPVNKGTLTAHGWISFESRNLWIAESLLTDERGRKIAIGKGRFVKSKISI